MHNLCLVGLHFLVLNVVLRSCVRLLHMPVLQVLQSMCGTLKNNKTRRGLGWKQTIGHFHTAISTHDEKQRTF